MTPNAHRLWICLALAATGCAPPKIGADEGADSDAAFYGAGGDGADGASGDDTATGEADTAGDEGGDGDGSSGRVESCDWPALSACFSFADQPDVEAWCEEVGFTYSVETVYGDGDCAAGAVGRCEGLTGADFGRRVATLYYYAGFSSDPREACEVAGGTYRPL